MNKQEMRNTINELKKEEASKKGKYVIWAIIIYIALIILFKWLVFG